MFTKIKKQMAAALAGLLIASSAYAASHREAPLISMDPTADMFSGFNVNTIAIEVPIEDAVGRNRNRVIGAYAATNRPRVTIIRKHRPRRPIKCG